MKSLIFILLMFTFLTPLAGVSPITGGPLKAESKELSREEKKLKKQKKKQNKKKNKEKNKNKQSGKGLTSVCKTVRNLQRGEVWKAKGSDHFSSGDPRRNTASFITLSGTSAPRGNCMYVYDKKGNLVGKLGAYARGEAKYSSRYYGASGCGTREPASQLAARAKKNTGSVSVFITSGTKNCALIPNPTRCVNSSAC